MTGQLTFDLPARAALGREDFFVSPANATALAAVEAPQDWPDGRLLILGPTGAGKTHLVQVWAAALPAGAQVIPATALAGADVPALAAGGAVAVEDAEQTIGAGEAALFHLHNLIAETGGRLLVTAALPPRDWGLALPDLKSRMEAIPVVRLDLPDDALLAAVLAKLFADRQLAVPAVLIGYLLPRMERSFAAAADIVARLDAAALARKQAITQRLASEVLDSKDADGEDAASSSPSPQ